MSEACPEGGACVGAV